MTISLEELATPPASPSSRVAIVVMDAALLADMLQLPKGCHIDAVDAPIDAPGTLRLRLRGAGWEVAPGCLIPIKVGVIRTAPADLGAQVPTVDWGLPPA